MVDPPLAATLPCLILLCASTPKLGVPPQVFRAVCFGLFQLVIVTVLILVSGFSCTQGLLQNL